jgi:hypothetical protein
MNGRDAEWHESEALLCGRSTCGNVPRGASEGKSKGFQFGPRSHWNQDRHAGACGRRLNGLMTQMTDGAVIG